MEAGDGAEKASGRRDDSDEMDFSFGQEDAKRPRFETSGAQGHNDELVRFPGFIA